MGECIIDTDSEISLISENGRPSGIIFYSGKFWVSDVAKDHMFAYTLEGVHDAESSFDFAIPVELSFGLAFHDSKLWVVSFKTKIVTSHDPFIVIDEPVKHQLDLGNYSPSGLTFYNDRFWLSDFNQDRIFVYKFAEGSSSKILHSLGDEFTIDVSHAQPRGIDFDNERLWVIEDADKKIHAYGADGTHYPDSVSYTHLTLPTTPYV